jgi:transcriptional/translational regulatory protein YebC/TACO1
MSGHSKWATIKHKKGAADKARGKLFAKIARQIEVSAKAGGGDIDSNPTLRTAVATPSTAPSSAAPARAVATPTSRSHTRGTPRAALRC